MAKKSFTITNVRPILSIEKPIVIFEVAGGDAIIRNPKQALTDLQNSGRALDVNAKEFNAGVENVSQTTLSAFVSALLDCANATLTGDINVIKAGDEYEIREGHPALTNDKHALYGTVKVGSKVKAEQDGVWVEGFLSIPLTEQEKMRRDVSGNISKALMAMYGFGGVSAPQAVQAPATPFEDAPIVPDATAVTAQEAFATTAKSEGK